MKRGHRGGFSMVEILAVVAVITVLAGLTAGAVSRGGSDAQLRHGGEMLGGLLDLARMEARSTGMTAVLVVIPDMGTASIFSRDLATGEWIQKVPWKTLPEPLVMDDRAGIPNSLMSGTRPAPGDFPAVQISRVNVASSSLRFIQFDAMGMSAGTGGQPTRIRLVTEAQKRESASGSSNYYDLLVLPGTSPTRHLRP